MHLRRAMALCVMQACIPGLARAEIPSLTREFETERYVVSAKDMSALGARRFVGLVVSGGLFQEGDHAGNWDPLGGWKQVGGGRAEVALTTGRWTVGADGIADTRRGVASDEFEQRVHATAYVPEARLSLTGAVGFESGYEGADVTFETLLFRPAVPSEQLDLRPRLWGWLRLRKLDGIDEPVLRPAVGLFIQHAIVVGSQAYLGATVQCDVSKQLLPRSELLVQLGFATNPRPLWGPEDPGPLDPAPPPIHRNLFAAVAYGAPLDARSPARLESHRVSRRARYVSAAASEHHDLGLMPMPDRGSPSILRSRFRAASRSDGSTPPRTRSAGRTRAARASACC